MPSPFVSAATDPEIAPGGGGGGGGGSGGGVFVQAPRARAPVSARARYVFFILYLLGDSRGIYLD